MSYWKRPTSISTSALDSLGVTNSSGTSGTPSQNAEFYEYEPAIVLDILLDKTHPYFTGLNVDSTRWPADINGKEPDKNDPDFTWMGRCLVRLIYTQRNMEKEDLVWALPLDANISEYPLLNEIVGVVKYLDKYYYTKKINFLNLPNTNANFGFELNSGGFRQTKTSPREGNRELQLTPEDHTYRAYIGPTSKLKLNGGVGYEGALGRYFYFNDRIRSLKRREGDLIIESRFGQSIRFAAYDDNRDNDKGYDDNFVGYQDYRRKGVKNPFSGKEAGGGNPMILIRNRQRPLTQAGKETRVYDNPSVPSVRGTDEEKNVGGYLIEDINNDGTAIHITSGTTVSGFVTNCNKRMWGNGSEEQPGFNGTTTFKFPKLNGDQLIANSDRIIISAKKAETFHFSKKRYAIVTDDEFTLDAHNQIVLTTNNKTVINSPAIYLGEYDATGEPVLLGQTTVNWLYDLCTWLITHTHYHVHKHPDAGKAHPPVTQVPVQAQLLITLQQQLNLLMSRRVFVTGGGLEPGLNGSSGNVKSGATPVAVQLPLGIGVPGGFTGLNRSL